MDIIKTLDSEGENGHPGRRKDMMRSRQLWLIIVALGLIIVLGGSWLLAPKLGINLPAFPRPFGGGVSSTPSGYRAVFLSNNQVYFGKVTDLNSQFPQLSDVYYLKVTQALQPGTAGTADNVKVAKGTATPAPQNELTLVKLGSEIHGPTDKIYLNRDHIIFVEDLKDDSKVVRAIKDYQEKNK